MTKPTFQFVEDYLEFIGGRRDANGKVFGLFDHQACPINLARYDVTVIDSLTSQTVDMQNAFTDKQAALAVKIVDKYRRQLSKLDPAIVLPDKLENFRLGIRIVDRSKSVTIRDDKFILKFPYDTKLIDTVKKQAKVGEGAMLFDHDNKVWRVSMTENMLNWIMAICPQNDFIIEAGVRDLYLKMLEIEQQGYNIILKLENDQLSIVNAPNSMLEYIDIMGGLKIENLLQLVDAAPTLGYQVDQELLDTAKELDYGSNFDFVINRKTVCAKDQTSLTEILDYAKKVNRLPIHVYDTGLPKESTQEIVYLNRGISADIVPKLLVTTTSLMIGSKKQSWMSNAEKIIILE